MGGFAVGFDWSGRLRMAYFNQGCVDGNILLAYNLPGKNNIVVDTLP